MSPGIQEQEVLDLAMKLENIVKWTEGKEVVKVIYVQDRILNIIVK